jgi:hypothetical protein
MLKNLTVNIQGVTALIQHNRRLADPLDEMTKAMKVVSAKRKKTDADYEELARLEFIGGLYIDDKGPYIPSEWIESMVRDGARKSKQGKDAVSACFATSDRFHIDYKGPKTADKLFEDPTHRDARIVKVGQSRIVRTRPTFPVWGLRFELTVNTEVIEMAHVEQAIQKAGMLVGLGDYRPKYGRFIVTSFEQSKVAA